MSTARPGSAGYTYRHGWIPVAGSGAVDKRSKAKQKSHPSAPANPSFVSRMSEVNVTDATSWSSGPRVGQKARLKNGAVVSISGVTPDGSIEFKSGDRVITRSSDEIHLMDVPNPTPPPTGTANPGLVGTPPPALSEIEARQTARYLPSAADAGYHPSTRDENLNTGWTPSEDQSAALYDYTGSSFEAINGLMRGKHDGGSRVDTLNDTIAKIDQAFVDSPPLTRNVVVTRGVSGSGPFPAVPPPMPAGAEFVDDAFGSTSKKARNAYVEDTLVEIRVPAGKKAIDVNHTSGSKHANEDEVLLPRGSRYRVVSDGETARGERHIVVEVV